MPQKDDQSERKALAPKCPICKKPAAPKAARDEAKSPYPFCSERCRLVDLGRWLDGAYQIPAEPGDPEDDAEAI